MAKRKKREKKVMSDNLYYAILTMDDSADGMPDGAWWAMLEDAVTQYNEVHNTSYDENDAVHAYLQRRHPETANVE